MKKILLITVLIFLVVSLYSNNRVTCFLGIPVDGSKKALIEKIKAKGFEYNILDDYFTGYYFGEPVYLFIQSKNDTVSRVIVYDIRQRDKDQIKERFNSIYKKYYSSSRYKDLVKEKTLISEKEDIDIETKNHKKVYKSVFNQTRTTMDDSLQIHYKIGLKKFPALDKVKLEQDHKERLRRMHAKAMRHVSGYYDGDHKRIVWFMINKRNNKYAVIICYDNLRNFPYRDNNPESIHFSLFNY